MDKKIAVAIVHGTGRKEPDFAEDTMEELHKKFPAYLPDGSNDAEIVMEPVYWADITRQREDDIWGRVKKSGPMQSLKMRRFIFNITGDTLAYQPSEGRRKLYLEVHKQMADAFKKLAERAGPEAPLCVLAHSMGTIVAHNFLYDMQNAEGGGYNDEIKPESPLEKCETLAMFITYGSPLAIWRLRFGDDYKAIKFPGVRVEEIYPNLDPKWLNIYDQNDVLGYPITRVTDSYEAMADEGYLIDKPQNVGAFWKSWNPLSHKGYFRDESSLDNLAGYLAAIWKGAYME